MTANIITNGVAVARQDNRVTMPKWSKGSDRDLLSKDVGYIKD